MTLGLAKIGKQQSPLGLVDDLRSHGCHGASERLRSTADR